MPGNLTGLLFKPPSSHAFLALYQQQRIGREKQQMKSSKQLKLTNDSAVHIFNLKNELEILYTPRRCLCFERLMALK